MKAKYKYIGLMTGLLLGLSCLAVNAATAAETAPSNNMSTKIAVVDYRQIMQQSPQAKEAIAGLKKRFQERENSIKSAQLALKQKEIRLQRDDAILKSAEKHALQNEIVGDNRKLKGMEEDFRQELSYAQEQALQGLLAQANKAIKTIAEKGKYDLVLERSRIPYVNSNNAQLDITNDVVKSLK